MKLNEKKNSHKGYYRKLIREQNHYIYTHLLPMSLKKQFLIGIIINPTFILHEYSKRKSMSKFQRWVKMHFISDLLSETKVNTI